MLLTAVFKAKARAALKGRWQTALLIMLIVNLPSLLVQGIASFTGNDVTVRLQDLALDYSRNTSMTSEHLLDSLRAVFMDPGIQAMLALSLLAWIITPCLALGMNHWTLDRLRGIDEPVSVVFSRLKIFLKSIGLRLLITLKVFLWMLPGAAVSCCSMIPLLTLQSNTREAAYSALRISSVLLYAGMGIMLVMGIIGYLRYELADFILADEPEERVLTCTRRSKQITEGRRGALLSLLLSFILWYLLVAFTASFVSVFAGPVIGLMFHMLGSLCLSIYVNVSEGAFFEALSPRSGFVSPVPDEP